MPELATFYGIRITINCSDHNPPHIHVQYGENNALVSLHDGSVIRGRIPRKQHKLVVAWMSIHEDELWENWELASQNQEVFKIAPLQ